MRACTGGAQAVPRGCSPQRVISALAILAVLLFLASITLLVAVLVLGPPLVAGGPMWSAPGRLSPALVNVLQGTGLLFGGLAVAVGVAAVWRGWRPPVRLLLSVGAAIAVLFVFLPPIGIDKDILNYAIYGRILALGHNPYVMTPAQLHRSGDPVGLLAPARYWQAQPTSYGPVATALQWVAAELGGASMAWIVFWIKIGNGIAFLATSAWLVRLARGDRARQARACLLWAVNPLMLFWLVGYGHVDVLLALSVVLALIVLRSRYGLRIMGGAVAGLVAGVAMAVKPTFAFAALGMAWAARRSPRIVVAGTLAAAAAFIPCYLLPGVREAPALMRRLTWNASFLHLPAFISSRPALFAALVLLAGLVLAGLLLRRLPPGYPALPAARPATALVLAYLAAFPTPGPWYYALIFPLLALLPASRLDYLVIALCLLLSELAIAQRVHAVYTLSHAGILLVLATLIVACLLRAWGVTSPGTAAARRSRRRLSGGIEVSSEREPSRA